MNNSEFHICQEISFNYQCNNGWNVIIFNKLIIIINPCGGSLINSYYVDYLRSVANNWNSPNSNEFKLLIECLSQLNIKILIDLVVSHVKLDFKIQVLPFLQYQFFCLFVKPFFFFSLTLLLYQRLVFLNLDFMVHFSF